VTYGGFLYYGMVLYEGRTHPYLVSHHKVENMSEPLIGVVVGGLIAWIAPLITLRYTERKWQFETKINYLKSERDRDEMDYEVNFERFGNEIIDNLYSSEMAAEVLALMPKEIGDFYKEWMAEKDKDDSKRKVAYFKMASKMKLDLANRDKEIRGLFDVNG
jgi:hypothetical protein